MTRIYTVKAKFFFGKKFINTKFFPTLNTLKFIKKSATNDGEVWMCVCVKRFLWLVEVVKYLSTMRNAP